MTTPRVMLTRPRRNYDGGASVTSSNKKEKSPGDTTPLPPLFRGRGEGGCLPQAGGENKNVADLVASASTLSEEQRRELVALLSLDLSSKPTTADRDIEMWATAVHEALQEALGGALGSTVGVLAVKRVVGAHKAFEPVAEFMKRSRLGENQVRERLSVYRLLAELLVAHARKLARYNGAPLSLKLVANCTGSVAGVFDAAFPGYLAAGLAPIVAARLTKK